MSFTPSILTARYGFKRKRRPPPARERLAKHSGSGSGKTIGTGFQGGDDRDEIFFASWKQLRMTLAMPFASMGKDAFGLPEYRRGAAERPTGPGAGRLVGRAG